MAFDRGAFLFADRELELQLALQRRQVQVQPLQLLLRRHYDCSRGSRRSRLLRRRRRRSLVAAHVASEGLTHREREAADGAGVGPTMLQPTSLRAQHRLPRRSFAAPPPRVGRPVAA